MKIQGYSPLYSPAAEAAFNTADRDKTDHNFDITLLARFTPSPRQSYEFGLASKTRSPNLARNATAGQRMACRCALTWWERQWLRG